VIPGTTGGEGASGGSSNDAPEGGSSSRAASTASAGSNASTLPDGATTVGATTGGMPAPPAGSAGARGIIDSPADCPRPSQLTCDDYDARTGCWCDPDAIASASECGAPWEFQCAAVLPASDGDQIFMFGGVPVGCSCDAEAFSPFDCDESYYFTCNQYAPVYAGCRCDATASPPGVEQCCVEVPVADGGFVEFECSDCFRIR